MSTKAVIIGLLWKFIQVFVLLIATSTSSLMAQNKICQRNIGKNSLAYEHSSLFLIVNHKIYNLNKEIILYVGIANDGNDNSIYLYKNIAWGYGGGLVLHVKDQSGKEVVASIKDDTMLPPPSRFDDQSIFVELKAGNFFGVKRFIALNTIIKYPGRYTLQVEYNSPLSCSIMDPKVQGIPALWHEDASIFSNKISIEVTQ